MSLYIKNIDTVNVEIGDLGITLIPNEEYDLTQDRPNIIATSSDLPAALVAGTVAVLDPLDDVTQLTLARAQEAVGAFNDSHYRIRGGDLNQLEDVVLTTPESDQVLSFNGSQWVNQTPASSQNVYTTITGDTGTATADTSSDTLNIVGDGNKITTSVGDTPDTVTISWGGITVTELTDVEVVGSPAVVSNEDLLWYNSTTLKWENVTRQELIGVPPAPPGTELSVQLRWGPIATVSATTSITIASNTLPTISQGTQIWSDTITPQSAGSTIRINTNITVAASTASMEMVLVAFRGTTAVGAAVNTTANRNKGHVLSFEIYDEPATTNTVTYSVRVGKNGGNGTWYVNTLPDYTNPMSNILERNAYTVEEIGVVS